MAQTLDTTHDRGDEPSGPKEARSDARRPSAKVAAVPALLALAIFVGGIGVLGYPAELMLVLAGVLFSSFAAPAAPASSRSPPAWARRSSRPCPPSSSSS